MIFISVAKDFTRFPAGRYKENGETSGQAFREKFLEEPLGHGEPVTVDFDGTVGYGSSFLEEAFGGLARKLKQPAEAVLKLLTLVSSDQTIRQEVEEYIREAAQAQHQ